jgi:hypothetical protein
LKLVQERARNTLEATGIGKDFLSRTQADQQLRERINKWDYMKLKRFCTTKEVVSKLKMLPTEWEKIIARYTLDEELKKQNFPQVTDPIKKWASELNRTFSKEEIHMAKKHMKKCSSSLSIKEMQIKTTLRFNLSLVRIATIKNTNNNKCWLDCREKGMLIHDWWECKLVQPLWETIWRHLKKLKIDLP